MSEEYSIIKNNELKSVHADFSFAEEMQKASRNEMWRNKSGLWTIISGACDDAVRQCYEKINTLVDSLADIDTCNVHALKSIAESVDLSYLCKNIKEDFPLDIANLIDLLSVPKHILLHSNRLLHPDSNATIEGEIINRASKIINDGMGYSIDLLYEIKKHVVDIREILNLNMVFTKRHLYEYDNELKQISKSSLISQEYYDYVRSLQNDFISDKSEEEQQTLQKTFDEAFERSADGYINDIIKIDFQDLKNYQYDAIDKDGKLNPFFALINICKCNLVNKEFGFFIIPTYFNEQENISIDLTALFSNIINSFESFDEKYAEDFICYHFYNTIVSKIKNSHLGSYFGFTNVTRKITKTVTESTYHFTLNDADPNEFTEDEFYERVLQFLTTDEIDDFIYQKYPKINAFNEKEEYSIDDTDFFTDSDEFKVKINQNLNKHLLDFVEYVKFINSALNNSKKYIRDVFNVDVPEKIEYDILKINYSSYPLYQKRIIDVERPYINNYDLILFGDGKHDGVIKRIAKELTDITTNISHIREQIKTSIQQYSFIGTRRIATDILRDFFIKNYSKKDEWNYISDILQKEDIDVSALFKPLSELLNSDQKFSIDVVEYYDNTKYLNIESDLPIVKTGTVLKEYEQRPSFWVDDHNLITSGLVSAAVYEDVYAPCSVYVNDYNKKFWGNIGKVITPSGFVDDRISLNANASDYDMMFGQFFSELDNVENEEERAKIISSAMVPLFNRIWDTFALSALSENPDALGELADVYRKYLGNSEGTHQYANEHNKIFPTIAPLVNVDNLVEVTNYVNDILFVAKAYYANVMPYVISSTKDMLKMHDENGVPHEGWRQNYINFHGYSTNYEYAKNVSVFENEPKKIFEFDGPFSYSMMQKIIYENYLHETEDDKVSTSTIESIVKYIDVSNSAVFKDAYDTYFNKTVAIKNDTSFANGIFREDVNVEEIPTYFTPSSDHFIGNYNIVKMEKDQYQNTYTLFKKCPKDEANNIDKSTTAVSGVLFFRSNDMMISLPLMQQMIQMEGEDFIVNHNFSTDATIEIIRKMVNGCIDFGVISNFMWMFSEIKDDLNKEKTIYKFISFKFSEDDHHIIVDEDTVRFYTNTVESLDSRIVYLNDYIGSVYEPDKEHVDFLFSDWEEMMQAASNIKDAIDKNEIEITPNDYLFGGMTIPIYRIRLDILNNKYEMMKIEVKDCVMPMLIEHFTENHINLNEPLHQIWGANKYQNKCTICYEALNREYDTSKFDYYFNFGATALKYQVLEICFNNSNYYTNEKYNDKINMSFSNKISFSLYEETAAVKRDAIYDKLLNLCYAYPKCIIKNGNLIVKILPFALTSYGSIEKQELFAESIAKNVYSLNFGSEVDNTVDMTSAISFSGVLREFNDYFKNAEAEYKILNDSYTSLNFINEIINDRDNELSIAPLCGILDYDESIQMSSSFEQANKIFEKIPFVTNCMTEKLKITVWFKNDTGITFIDDRAVDLDLTCYIDDPFEKDKKVGYWNKYIRTRYIEWTGDDPNKEHEELLVDVNKYLKDKRGINEMKINLNLCWHDSSQIKTQDVYVMVNWQNVVENIPIQILGDVNKDCTTRSLSLLIHPDKNNTLTYELPNWYPVIKIAYKDEIVAYEDGIPDIQLGFLNLTQSELQRYQKEWFSVNYYEDELSGVVKFSAFRHNSKLFKTNSKEVPYVSYLINEPLFGDMDNIHLKSLIVSILSDHIRINSSRLNYVTKERFNYVEYTRMCVEELFFGPKISNEDPETGVNMIYYSFLNPTFFKDSDTINNHTYPIEAAVADNRMNYNVGYDYYYNSEAVSGLVQMILYTMSTGEYLDYEETDHTNLPELFMRDNDKEMIDKYLHSVKNPDYSVYDFFMFAWNEIGNPQSLIIENFTGQPEELASYILNNIDEDFRRYYPMAVIKDYLNTI